MELLRRGATFSLATSALLSFAIAACSDASSSPTPTPSEGSPDAGTDAPATPECIAPTAAPPWLDMSLADRVAKLSGEAEITPGTKLAERTTPEGRRVARDYLAGELRGLGIDTAVEDYATGANVVGRLPPLAEGASEWVLIGAHFDAVEGSPGANDNASGVATVLAVARSLKELPCRTRGVMIVLFDEEEINLRGSKAFAQAQKTAGTKLVAVHTLDQVAWDADGDRTFEIEQPTPALFAEYQAAATAVGATVVETKTNTSDHQAFRTLGFAAAGVTEEYVNGDTTPEYHKPGDKQSTVNAAFHALSARLLTNVVAREIGAR